MATALPTSPTAQNIEITWASNSLAFVSPLSGSTQTSSRLGGVWQLSITLPPMTRYQAGEWHAAIFGVDGQATALEAGPDHPHTLDWYDANAPASAQYGPSLWLEFVSSDYRIRYASSLTVLANGAASAQATTLAVDGLDGIGLNRGDWFTVDNGTYKELHMVTADAFPNASGEATLSIHPPLRRAVADNAAVTIENPRGEFIFTENDGAKAALTRQGVYGPLTLELREFLR